MGLLKGSIRNIGKLYHPKENLTRKKGMDIARIFLHDEKWTKRNMLWHGRKKTSDI